MAQTTITEALVDEAQRMLALVERLETLPDVVEIMDIARCERTHA
jgi:hypothetical protein